MLPLRESPLRRTQSSRKIAIRPAVGSSSRLSDLVSEESAALSRETEVSAMSPIAKLRDDAAKRESVVNEIVETERSYLSGLDELCRVYIKAGDQPVVSNSGRVKGTVLPSVERKAVFGNVVSARICCVIVLSLDKICSSSQEAIRDLSRDVILPELLEATQGTHLRTSADSVAIACRVAHVFQRHARTLK